MTRRNAVRCFSLAIRCASKSPSAMDLAVYMIGSHFVSPMLSPLGGQGWLHHRLVAGCSEECKLESEHNAEQNRTSSCQGVRVPRSCRVQHSPSPQGNAEPMAEEHQHVREPKYLSPQSIHLSEVRPDKKYCMPATREPGCMSKPTHSLSLPACHTGPSRQEPCRKKENVPKPTAIITLGLYIIIL